MKHCVIWGQHFDICVSKYCFSLVYKKQDIMMCLVFSNRDLYKMTEMTVSWNSHSPMSLSNVSLLNFSWIQYFSTLKICSLLEFCLRNVLPKITSNFSTLALKKENGLCLYAACWMVYFLSLCEGCWSFLLVLEAVRRRQDPTGVN